MAKHREASEDWGCVISTQALALVLLAGLIHAGWNILAKKTGGDARFAFFTSVWLMLVWAPLGLWLGWCAVPAWGVAEWAVVSVSAVLHVVYFVTLLRGYRAADLTVVYPLARGTGPLLSSIGAVLLLGEAVTWGGVLGVLGVVLGVVLIAGGARLWRPAPSPVARQQLHRGLYYGLLTGVWIAGYTVVDGYAVKVMALSPILVDYVGNALRVLLLAPVALRDRAATARLWRAQWRGALVVALFSPVAYVLVLYAVQQAPLSHVAPAREVSMLFAALIGGRLLGEGNRVVRVAGALLIGAGVLLLALG